jgi:hypothetical protein
MPPTGQETNKSPSAGVVLGNWKSSKWEAEMAGKRQSNENVRQPRRLAELGQKKAKLEKAIKEELKHMERSAAKSAPRKAKEADLGQKEARLEKASKEELEHMGGCRRTSTAPREVHDESSDGDAQRRGVGWSGDPHL